MHHQRRCVRARVRVRVRVRVCVCARARVYSHSGVNLPLNSYRPPPSAREGKQLRLLFAVCPPAQSLTGALYFADLAGSERLGKSGATGERLKETQAIRA